MIKKYIGPYGEYLVEIKISNYQNGQKRIDFIDSEDGFPVLVATVAIKEELNPSEIAIKNYSENEGVLDFLIKEGIVSPPLRYFNSGYVNIPICEFKGEYKIKISDID